MNKRQKKKRVCKEIRKKDIAICEYKNLLNKYFDKESCAFLLSLSYINYEELTDIFAKFGVVTKEDLIETMVCFNRNIDEVKKHFSNWPHAKDILLRTSITMLEDLTCDSDTIKLYFIRDDECRSHLLKSFVDELTEKLMSDAEPYDVALDFTTFMDEIQKYFDKHNFGKSTMPTYAEQTLYDFKEEFFAYIARWENVEKYREWAVEMKAEATQKIQEIEDFYRMIEETIDGE